MREIKFRAWTGMTMEYQIVVGKLGAFYVEGLDPEDSACMSPFNTIYSEQTPVMQFTGLLDKNGKEIFEGDVVKWNGKKWPIYWSEGLTQYMMGHGQDCATIMKGRCAYLEVIGNIYENPNILKL